MTAERLTDRTARTAKVETGHKLLADGRGLYLRVTATGGKSWVYRYMANGQRHDMGLGPYPDVGLADAREKALGLRRTRLEGQDPLLARRTSKATVASAHAAGMTFETAADQFIAGHRSGWRSTRHEDDWRRSLTYAYPVIGNLAVSDIDTAAVLRVLSPVWQTKNETASRLRGRIEAILGWATIHGFRSGDNPARWRGHLEHSLPKPGKVQGPEDDRRHAAMPYGEVSALLAELRGVGSMTAKVIEFAILTAARVGEVTGARWEEFDLAKRFWTVPASRIKAGREHRVPLSDAAMTILEQLAALRTSDFVFPARHGGAMLRQQPLHVLKRLRPNATVHGFRSSFRDWAAERTAYPREVVELCLAHNVGSAVERAYQRSDLFERRRELMNAWAQYCTTPAGEGEVVPLRA